MKTTVIIGGGLGGLFAGAILSREGFKVTVWRRTTLLAVDFKLSTLWNEVRYGYACHRWDAPWR